MKILVLNHGSSSVKCAIYDFQKLHDEPIDPIWEKKWEWKNVRHRKEELTIDLEFDCVGHRIVHGGKYTESVVIDDEVKKEIRRVAEFAPLHNMVDLEGIELFSNKPQIAVFDTAFHQTLPAAAATYPGPYEWLSMGVKRFGFHGINYQYCTRRATQILGYQPEKMVICHLGSGASLCAAKKGKSIDTTMGFTPLEGLMMDTRSGTVDPGIILYLMKQGRDLTKELYEKSGLLGLSGLSSDMRDILENAEKGHARAKLALDVYLHRLISMIGSMVATLGGLEVLVFTGGIGENAPFVRDKVASHLSFLNPKMVVIPANEAFEIARECWKINNPGKMTRVDKKI